METSWSFEPRSWYFGGKHITHWDHSAVTAGIKSLSPLIQVSTSYLCHPATWTVSYQEGGTRAGSSNSEKKYQITQINGPKGANSKPISYGGGPGEKGNERPYKWLETWFSQRFAQGVLWDFSSGGCWVSRLLQKADKTLCRARPTDWQSTGKVLSTQHVGKKGSPLRWGKEIKIEWVSLTPGFSLAGKSHQTRKGFHSILYRATVNL